jgi:hypothetical protein
MHQMVATQEDALKHRLEQKKANPVKQSKSERLAGVVERAGERDKEIRTPTRKEIRMTDTSGDGKEKPKKEKKDKKLSQTVIEWRKLPKEFPEGKQKIHIIKTLAEKPKRNKALERFALYRNGMTVDQYIEESHKAGTPKGMAREDVRWDYVKKFIEIK